MKLTMLRATAVAAFVVFALGSSAQAAVTLTGSLSAWKGAVSDWTETTGFDLPDFTVVDSFSDDESGSSTININPGMGVRTVGSPDWQTWCCGYNGQVLDSNYQDSFTFTPSTALTGMGLFVEPLFFTNYDFTMTTSTGQVLTQSVYGDSGAAFFGWYGQGVTSITISSNTNQFAVGDFFTGGGVPEPQSWTMMLVGIGAIGAAMRMTRNKNRTAISSPRWETVA